MRKTRMNKADTQRRDRARDALEKVRYSDDVKAKLAVYELLLAAERVLGEVDPATQATLRITCAILLRSVENSTHAPNAACAAWFRNLAENLRITRAVRLCSDANAAQDANAAPLSPLQNFAMTCLSSLLILFASAT